MNLTKHWWAARCHPNARFGRVRPNGSKWEAIDQVVYPTFMAQLGRLSILWLRRPTCEDLAEDVRVAAKMAAKEQEES